MKITAKVGLKDSGRDSDTYQLMFKSHELTVKELLKALGELKPNMPLYISFIEGLEGGLHPKEQRELMDKIKTTKSEGHLIFTTCSPYIVNELEVEQVEVWYKGKYKLLSELPDIEWAKRTLTTGEIWDAEGEVWIEDIWDAEEERWVKA